MNLDSPPPYEPGHTIFESTETALIEVCDTEGEYEVFPKTTHWNAAHLLGMMRSRLHYYGAPLPEGFVAPPGIDLDALLKQVPWPPDDQPTA